MKTTLQNPIIHEMIEAGFDLIYTCRIELLNNPTDFFKNANQEWFFSPTTACGEKVIECWRRLDYQKLCVECQELQLRIFEKSKISIDSRLERISRKAHKRYLRRLWKLSN